MTAQIEWLQYKYIYIHVSIYWTLSLKCFISSLTGDTEKKLKDTEDERDQIIKEKDEKIDELNKEIRKMEKDYKRILDVSTYNIKSK